MTRRVSPIEAIHAEIDAVFAEGRPLAECLEQVARLGAKLIIQTALEAEVDEFLGRARYQRADAVGAKDGEKSEATEAPAVRTGHRNGHRGATIKTTSGPVTVAKPRLRGTTEQFASRLFGRSVTRTNALESLVIASFVRGLSTRDVQNTLAEALGSDAALSKSTVSSICQSIRGEYDVWRERDLTGVTLDYLFLDASHFRMHPNAPAEPVLAAWGIDTDGKPVFIGLEAAASESHDAWAGFLTGLIERGLQVPLLVISDGGGGLISACETVLHRSLRQRCLVHKCRNVLSKVSLHDQEQVKKEFWEIFDTGELGLAPGQQLVETVQRRIDAFAAKWQPAYPAAVKSLLTDRSSLTSYLRFPVEHHKRIRHSNFIERTFGETRRRVKVIGRFPGETSCVSLAFAVLSRAATGWRGFTTTPGTVRQLERMRGDLLHPADVIQLAPWPRVSLTKAA
ncbi:IS256 family transposase [Streptomyces sp. NRRL B-1677]|uniref:IS256 family transposase n=1 Tax=Streptomyces sp. NRRL B-1677 TaxID=2682966 RepID=UPI0018929059|nr:IS256 family transposase [Streptomyces sp. NRRL B-1677]MBF6046402.1 IS256 family transposase [Streptomyces sp. NRRL B-1677]